MTVNLKQFIAIVIAVLSVLAVSTSSLTDIFGTEVAKVVVPAAGLLNTILSAALAVITSQGATVKNVLAMPGVQKIDVNSQANKTLAQIAVDPKQDKIGPQPDDVETVTQIAQGS